ncbi:MAG: LysE family transporter [Deltaproteobacteria bacterium]|nr:LysE family transporter [Deltaproteobacteria bacterium]
MNLPMAFAIGFAVASLPGPILVLITTESLRRGLRAGVLAMIAPLLIDALVMLPLALLLQVSIVRGTGVVGLGLAGGGLLVWFGYQSIRVKTGILKTTAAGGAGGFWKYREVPSFVKGILTHLTNPYPYIYWGTVGVLFIKDGFEQGGTRGAILFPVGFWLGAGTFNFLVVYLVSRGRGLLPPRLEPCLHRVSGVLLMASGAFVALRTWWTFS